MNAIEFIVTTHKDEIRDYLAENIDNYETRVGLAWDTIDKWRCPISYADPALYNEIVDFIEEWCEDNLDDFISEDYISDELVEELM